MTCRFWNRKSLSPRAVHYFKYLTAESTFGSLSIHKDRVKRVKTLEHLSHHERLQWRETLRLKANQRKHVFNSTKHTQTSGEAERTEYIRYERLLWAQSSTEPNLQLQPPTKDIVKSVSITRGERGGNRTRDRGRRERSRGEDFKLLQRMSFMCEC